jgi:hypothetical protein
VSAGNSQDAGWAGFGGAPASSQLLSVEGDLAELSAFVGRDVDAEGWLRNDPGLNLDLGSLGSSQEVGLGLGWGKGSSQEGV